LLFVVLPMLAGRDRNDLVLGGTSLLRWQREDVTPNFYRLAARNDEAEPKPN
jgi:hypothetical protein